jgi:hypothetical protein
VKTQKKKRNVAALHAIIRSGAGQHRDKKREAKHAPKKEDLNHD